MKFVHQGFGGLVGLKSNGKIFLKPSLSVLVDKLEDHYKLPPKLPEAINPENQSKMYQNDQ